MPPSHVGWTGDDSRELIWWVEFLILDELAESLSTVLIVVEFEEAEFGGTNGGTDELVDIALVLGVEEQFPLLVEVLMVLFLELDHMFEDEFFLGCVLLVGDPGTVLLLELPASLQLLVDDHLPPLEELQQLVVHLVLHF